MTMKKYLSILMLMAICLSAQAEELKIGGVSVNLTQNTSYGQGGLVSGFYTYNYVEKKLDLYSAIIYGQIVCDVKDLNIIFHGTTYIMTKATTLWLASDTHLTNEGTVNLTVDEASSLSLYVFSSVDISGGIWSITGSIGFYGEDSKLTIKGGAEVSLTPTPGKEVGIERDGGLDHNIVEVDNSTLKVESTGECIETLVVLKNSVIASPLKAVLIDRLGQGLPSYSSSEWRLLRNTKGEPLTGSLTIKPGTAYDLWISGVQVNSENINNIWQLGKSGSNTNSITYNLSTKTLSLNNAQLDTEYTRFPPIHSEVNGLKINTVGNCYIGGDNNGVGIESTADFSINGDGSNGSLQVFGNGNNSAISVGNSTLTINDATLKAIGDRFSGLSGDDGSTIHVNNSYLTVSGSWRAIDVGSFDPDDNCFIMSPTGGYKAAGTVMQSGTPATYVQTRPMVKYALLINGKQVNEDNCNNIKRRLLGMYDESTPGSISFCPPNELRMENIQISVSNYENYFIGSELDELILNLTGTNYLRTQTGKTLVSTHSVTMKGTGSLEVESNDPENPVGAYINDNLKLTESVQFRGTGNLTGIACSKLIMEPGTTLAAKAYSEEGRSLWMSSAPELDGVAWPSSMYYDTSKYCVCYRSTGQPVTQEIVPINAANAAGQVTSIDEIPTEETAETTVYTTSGQLVWQGKGSPQLPRGIYVVKQGGKARKALITGK